MAAVWDFDLGSHGLWGDLGWLHVVVPDVDC